jgi:hypothetical protein
MSEEKRGFYRSLGFMGFKQENRATIKQKKILDNKRRYQVKKEQSFRRQLFKKQLYNKTNYPPAI